MHLIRFVGAVGLFVACFASAASADASAPDTSELPTALIIGGKAKTAELASVRAAVLDVLHVVPWKISDDVQFSDPEVAQIRGCLTSEDRPWPCVATVLRSKGVERVLVVDVGPDKKGAQLVLTGQVLSATAPDDVPPNEATYCPLPRCTENQLRAAANLLAKELVEAFNTNAIRRANATTDTHQGATGATVTPTKPPTLPPSKPVPPILTPVQHSITVPIILVTVGGVGIVGGAVALALNQKASIARRSEFYYSTTTPGAITLVAGALVAVAGGVLWWHYRHSTTAPAVAIAPGGAVFGLQGSF